MADEIYTDTDRDYWASPEDRAWAAGLFEGEGCFTISGVESPHARVKLNMIDEDVVRHFARIVEVGQVRVEDALIKRGNLRQWEWYAAAKRDVALVIWLLWDHLGVRRQQRAEELLANIQRRPLKD